MRWDRRRDLAFLSHADIVIIITRSSIVIGLWQEIVRSELCVIYTIKNVQINNRIIQSNDVCCPLGFHHYPGPLFASAVTIGYVSPASPIFSISPLDMFRNSTACMNAQGKQQLQKNETGPEKLRLKKRCPKPIINV